MPRPLLLTDTLPVQRRVVARDGQTPTRLDTQRVVRGADNRLRRREVRALDSVVHRQRSDAWVVCRRVHRRVGNMCVGAEDGRCVRAPPDVAPHPRHAVRLLYIPSTPPRSAPSSSPPRAGQTPRRSAASPISAI